VRASGTRVDTSAAAATVTAPFPVEWNVHQWSSVWLVLHAHRAFTIDELAALIAAVQRAVRNWNAREPHKIQYLAEPEIARDRAALRCYLDLGAAGASAVVAAINRPHLQRLKPCRRPSRSAAASIPRSRQ